jgi:hypothetical protein
MLTRASESSLGEPAMPPVGRRNRWRLLAGVLVVFASAAGFVAFNTAATDTTPVLMVARPVAMGQPLSSADVRVVDVRLAAGVEAIPAGEVDLVVGRPAAVPLLAGALLTREQVGPAAVPQAGEVLVAVSVPLPPAGLAAGARVRVLVAPGGGTAGAAATDEGQVGVLATATATVAEVGPVDGTGGRVVSLLLRSVDGEQVATAAMLGQVSLILEAGAG